MAPNKRSYTVTYTFTSRCTPDELDPLMKRVGRDIAALCDPPTLTSYKLEADEPSGEAAPPTPPPAPPELPGEPTAAEGIRRRSGSK